MPSLDLNDLAAGSDDSWESAVARGAVPLHLRPQPIDLNQLAAADDDSWETAIAHGAGQVRSAVEPVDLTALAAGCDDSWESAVGRAATTDETQLVEEALGAFDLLTKAFNPDEARDDHGRWTATGGGYVRDALGDHEFVPSFLPRGLVKNARMMRQAYYSTYVKNGAAKSPYEAAERLQAVANGIGAQGVWTRVTPAILGSIVRDGRFKSQHEVDKSNGFYNPEMRGKFENTYLGVPIGHEPPVYGYMDGSPDGAGNDKALNMYGQVAVRLRDDVRDRTTWTNGDSWDKNWHWLAGTPASVLPSKVDAPSPLSVNTNELSPHLYKAVYNEAQIHGGVSVKDIAEVVFSRKRDATPELRKALDAAGVKWRMAGA